MDVNRQAWSSQTSLLVHPAFALCRYQNAGEPLCKKAKRSRSNRSFPTLTASLIAGKDAEIKAVLKDWVFDKGSMWSEKIIDEQNCSIKSTDTAQKCSFIAKQGGRYTVTATVMDDRERFNESELTIWFRVAKLRQNAMSSRKKFKLSRARRILHPAMSLNCWSSLRLHRPRECSRFAAKGSLRPSGFR